MLQKRGLVATIIIALLYSVIVTILRYAGISLGGIPTIVLFLVIEGLVALVLKKKKSDNTDDEKNEEVDIESISNSEAAPLPSEIIDNNQSNIDASFVQEKEKLISEEVTAQSNIAIEHSVKKKPNTAVLFLAFTTVFFLIITVVLFVQNMNYLEKYNNLENQVEELQTQFDETNKNYENLQNEFDELNVENIKIKYKLKFYEEYAACINENSNYYHKYCECKNFDDSSFLIYNVATAKSKGYKPCPYCFD